MHINDKTWKFPPKTLLATVFPQPHLQLDNEALTVILLLHFFPHLLRPPTHPPLCLALYD